jgi:hypothetical protein
LLKIKEKFGETTNDCYKHNPPFFHFGDGFTATPRHAVTVLEQRSILLTVVPQPMTATPNITINTGLATQTIFWTSVRLQANK